MWRPMRRPSQYPLRGGISAASPPSKLFDPPGKTRFSIVRIDLVQILRAIAHSFHHHVESTPIDSTAHDVVNNLPEFDRTHERVVAIVRVRRHHTIESRRAPKRTQIGPSRSDPDGWMRRLHR